MFSKDSSRPLGFLFLFVWFSVSFPFCVSRSPQPLPGQTQEKEFEQRRLEMVRDQIEGEGVSDTSVLRAMRHVPRHLFVPAEYAAYAYTDRPLPIGYDQTISQPYIVGLMTELLALKPGHRVLEVGTGSGYQAAVLAEIVDSVWTIEILEPLASTAQQRLQSLGYGGITVRCGDGYAGWAEHAPFDRIIVTAAAEEIPKPLLDQLMEGGRMVIPVGPAFSVQALVLVEKHGGKISEQKVAAVRFVPLVREK